MKNRPAIVAFVRPIQAFMPWTLVRLQILYIATLGEAVIDRYVAAVSETP